jgi:hypothetical protein
MASRQRLSFQGSAAWASGDTNTKSFELGSEPPDAERTGALNLLRVGYVGSELQGSVSAKVKLGDLGNVVGPLDVPFTLVAEAPFVIELTPGGDRVATHVILSCRCVDSDSASYANRTVVVNIADVVALPQWVRSVQPLAPATYTYRDRTGTPLSGVLSGTSERPAAASEVLISAAGAIVLHY